MEAIYISSKGEPIFINDLNAPPAGVPSELVNFLKTIKKCTISFDKDKYDREKKAAHEKYIKEADTAEKQVKASKAYKDLEKAVSDSTTDIAAQNNNITTLNASNPKHDKAYVDKLSDYNDKIEKDKNTIRADQFKMNKMISDAIAKVKEDEVKIEFKCEKSKACSGDPKCPLRNLFLRTGDQLINKKIITIPTIRNKKVDRDTFNKFNNNSIYFCPCEGTEEDEIIYELVDGEFKKVELKEDK